MSDEDVRRLANHNADNLKMCGCWKCANHRKYNGPNHQELIEAATIDQSNWSHDWVYDNCTCECCRIEVEDELLAVVNEFNLESVGFPPYWSRFQTVRYEV